MGDTHINLSIEDYVDQGNARNETPHPETLREPSPVRVVLPRGSIHFKVNPFVLCRVLSQRTLQLATRYPGKPLSQVIKITMTEFREGKLQYLISQFSTRRRSS